MLAVSEWVTKVKHPFAWDTILEKPENELPLVSGFVLPRNNFELPEVAQGKVTGTESRLSWALLGIFFVYCTCPELVRQSTTEMCAIMKAPTTLWCNFIFKAPRDSMEFILWLWVKKTPGDQPDRWDYF